METKEEILKRYLHDDEFSEGTSGRSRMLDAMEEYKDQFTPLPLKECIGRPKPIFVIECPLSMSRDEFSRGVKGLGDKMTGYHILMIESAREEFKFQLFSEKDITEVEIGKMEEIVKNLTKAEECPQGHCPTGNYDPEFESGSCIGTPGLILCKQCKNYKPE